MVDVRYLKWGGAPHWRMEMERLGEDEHGMWLGARPGTLFRRGKEKALPLRHSIVVMVPGNEWWTIANNAGNESIDVYVDVTTPAEWHGDEVRIVDLDLDVIRERDGTVKVLDEDEFEEHRVELGYPDEVVARVRSTADRLREALTARAEPFGDTCARWMRMLAVEVEQERGHRSESR